MFELFCLIALLDEMVGDTWRKAAYLELNMPMSHAQERGHHRRALAQLKSSAKQRTPGCQKKKAKSRADRAAANKALTKGAIQWSTRYATGPTALQVGDGHKGKRAGVGIKTGGIA